MRAQIALSVALAAGIFGFSVAAGVTGSTPASLAVGALVAGLVAAWAWRRPAAGLDPGATSRALRILSLLAAVVALVQVSRLTIFMVEPSRVSCSAMPSSTFEVRHNCLTSYFVAGEAARKVANIYDDALYSLPGTDPGAPRKPRLMGDLRIDAYEYPPQFLLLPRALGLVAPDFWRLRTLWHGLTGGVLLLGLLLVARSLPPAAATRALLLSPLVWVAFPTLSAMQKGNFQLMAIAMSMIAMVCFERRRFALGGGLLAFATVSKLFPGMLLVYLLARRQWRPLAWTVALSAGFTLATFVDLGSAPFVAFLQHLPGLVGGEAFPAFRNPAAVAINYSLPGLIFKLHLFGVSGMGFPAAKVVGWIYTLALLGATVAIARRVRRDEDKPVIWMAILVLATLRSPFLPQGYGAFPPIWLLTLLAARHAPTLKVVCAIVLSWLVLDIYLPMDWATDPRVLAAITTVPQIASLVLAAIALRLPPIQPPLRESVLSREATPSPG